MPAEIRSRGFKDISLSFKYNPLNKDIIALKNEAAIARSVRNLVLTNFGESFFNYEKGSDAARSLFENLDSLGASILQSRIRTLIARYEPRVRVTNVIAVANLPNGQFDINVLYDIVGLALPTQNIVFALAPTR